jgi:hypothetical protein
MKRWLFSITALVALLLVPFASHAQGQEVEIPPGPTPTLDGEMSPGEWGGAAEFPLEGLPLHARALHDGESAYLAFEVLTPAEEWETFTVRDNGDGEWYDAGDEMVLCTADGCQRCDYSAPLDFTCADEGLPSGVDEGLAEVQVSLDLLAGQVVVGAVVDGVEYISDPFDVEFGEVAPATEEPSPPPAQPVAATEEPTEEGLPAGEEVVAVEEGLPLWAYILLALSLAALAAVLAFVIPRAWRSRECRLQKAAREAEKHATYAEKAAAEATEARTAGARHRKVINARTNTRIVKDKCEKAVAETAKATAKANEWKSKAEAAGKAAATAAKNAEQAVNERRNEGPTAKVAEKAAKTAWGVARAAEAAAQHAEEAAKDAERTAKATQRAAEAAKKAAAQAKPGSQLATSTSEMAAKAEACAKKAADAAEKASEAAKQAREAANKAREEGNKAWDAAQKGKRAIGAIPKPRPPESQPLPAQPKKRKEEQRRRR